MAWGDDFHKGGKDYWKVLDWLRAEIGGALKRFPEVPNEDKRQILQEFVEAHK